MKIFNRIKNILFDEEESEEIPVIEKKEPVKVEIPKVETPPQIKEKKAEKEVYEPRRNFSFPDLTEEINLPSRSFDNIKEETRSSRSLNILEYEKKQKKEKTLSFRKEKVEETKKAFKPSPVISPVYGIVERTFESEPKVKKVENYGPISTAPLDVDSVRRKAYGTLEDDIVNTLEKNVEEFYEPKEEKTIDELLVDDVADEVIEEFGEEKEKPKKEMDLLDEIDNKFDSKMEESSGKNIVPDDTIESDLFNLIDSMYEERDEKE